MIEGVKSLSEKENSISEFTVQFFADSVSIDATVLPLGQISTDVLNLSNEVLLDFYKKSGLLCDEVERCLLKPQREKDIALAETLQSCLNDVLEIVYELPLYRTLDIDREFGSRLFLHTYQNERKTFQNLFIPYSFESIALTGFLSALKLSAAEAISFRLYVQSLVDKYYERLKRKNSEYYAIGLYDFLRNIPEQQKIESALPQQPGFGFFQSRRAMVEYTTMPNPANPKEYMIAERMVFNSLGTFLHVDFFRGLMHGNAPRRCHNCGHFFLLSSGYDARYCNNIAPGETERTCRKIGAHRKETQKAGSSMIQAEYKKVYSRLKTRKFRKKIEDDEWNRQVALAQDYKEQAERGEISEFELKRIYDGM